MKRLHFEELRDFYFSPNKIIVRVIKLKKMGQKVVVT
jgi:hypothetical protein